MKDAPRLLEVRAFLEGSPGSALAACIARSVRFVQNCLGQYDNLAISFNGGKDCTAVLHVVRYAIFDFCEFDEARYDAFMSEHMSCVFFETVAEFDEVLAFIRHVAADYDIPVRVFAAASMRRALQDFLAVHPTDAIFMGVRRGDPHATSDALVAHATAGWPAVTRLRPLLFWTFTDVWDFLLRFEFAYCSLYARGFTSLGAAAATSPHPSILSAAAALKRPAARANIAVHADTGRSGSPVSPTDEFSDYLRTRISPVPPGTLEETTFDALVRRGMTPKLSELHRKHALKIPSHAVFLPLSESERSGRM